jgi:hypothetical protein
VNARSRKIVPVLTILQEDPPHPQLWAQDNANEDEGNQNKSHDIDVRFFSNTV